MPEGLDNLLVGDGQAGLSELRQLLHELFGGSGGRIVEQQKLPSRHSRAYRIRFAGNGHGYSVVLKRLAPAIAYRNRLVLRRWLPAIGLGDSAAELIGVAAARNGECVWHVYE